MSTISSRAAPPASCALPTLGGARLANAGSCDAHVLAEWRMARDWGPVAREGLIAVRARDAPRAEARRRGRAAPPRCAARPAWSTAPRSGVRAFGPVLDGADADGDGAAVMGGTTPFGCPRAWPRRPDAGVYGGAAFLAEDERRIS